MTWRATVWGLRVGPCLGVVVVWWAYVSAHANFEWASAVDDPGGVVLVTFYAVLGGVVVGTSVATLGGFVAVTALRRGRSRTSAVAAGTITAGGAVSILGIGSGAVPSRLLVVTATILFAAVALWHVSRDQTVGGRPGVSTDLG